MKTNVLKSAVLFAALSIAFTSCEKDSLVTEMETKKVKSEQIRPIENKNDRELEREIFQELPIRREITPTPTPTAPVKKQKQDKIILQKEIDTK